MSRNVVVTGFGPVTSIGVGAEEFHRGQHAGRSGVRPVTRFAPRDELGPCVAGEVDVPDSLELTRRQRKKLDRASQLALVGAGLAIGDAELDLDALDRTRIGVAVGTGAGNLTSLLDKCLAAWERGSRRPGRDVPQVMSNAVAVSVAIAHRLSGPASCPSVACASGAEALVAAHQMITAGEADIVVAGGAEAPIVPEMLSSLRMLGALAADADDPAAASRPFSASRDGFVLAEGAGLLILESEESAVSRGARIRARFAGYGRTCDAYHVVAPRLDGGHAARAIEVALKSAGLVPSDISHINAHGTGTMLSDAAEAAAIRTALDDWSPRVPISATKSQTGHPIGAAGAIGAIAAIQAITTGTLPPTLNLDRPDPAFDLDFVGPSPRRHDVTAALANSFGFGGHNVVLAFTRA